MIEEYKVKVLKTGYCVWLDDVKMRAGGTITLLKGPKNLLVDTGSPQDKAAILAGLKEENLTPEQIDYVICTHGHSDHIGNNNLFPKAVFIVGFDLCSGDVYTWHNFNQGSSYHINSQVEVIPTPGHSGQDVSVLVRTQRGAYAIVGDLFESMQDLENPQLWKAQSLCPVEQGISRRMILQLADYIVPGHGEIFKVNGWK